MNEEVVPNDMRETVQRLRQHLNMLINGVKISGDGDTPEMIQLEQLDMQELKEDVGTLLVHSRPDQVIEFLWDILKAHIPAEVEKDTARYEELKELSSKPLQGRPSEILGKTGFAREGDPMKKMIEKLQTGMDSRQNLLLPQITGRI